MAGFEKFVVFSKENCTYCQQAKNLLLIKGKNFEVKMLDVDYDKDYFLIAFPEQKTFPMIIREVENTAQYIGGFDKLKEYFNADY